MDSNNVLIDFYGQKMCIEGVTRYTTCDDVIEMVFYYLSATVDASSYAVFESSYGVERMLYGKESVLKVMRSWGTDRNNFTLLLRKVDNIRSMMATFSKAKRKLQKIRSQNLNKPAEVINNYTIEANLNKVSSKEVKVKDVVNANKNEKERHSKLAMLKRFLSDVGLQKKAQPKGRSRSHTKERTPGDGCSASPDNRCERSMSISTARKVLSVHQVGLPREEVDIAEASYLQRHNSYLNAAFVEADDSCDSSFYTINKCSDEESAFEDESDIESVCDHERNIDEYSDVDFENSADDNDSDSDEPFCDANNTVIKCARIIDLFCKGEKYKGEINDEDIDMDSFMNTLVYDSESDEGLSSLDSDTD